MNVPFVHSRFERRTDDTYLTIDSRCVDALLATWPVSGRIVDCCAPNGSGIVDALTAAGKDAHGEPAAFADFHAAWIVTNPPYKRGLVDRIAEACVERVRAGTVMGAAFLMRANWDFAGGRAKLFEAPAYAGQTKMRFRPWWSEDRSAQPIHSFCWHVWVMDYSPEPVVRYWP